jgi:hypothetical protein
VILDSDFVIAATLPPNPVPSVQQKLQWQIASDSLFTSNARYVESDFVNPGALAATVGLPRLPQGLAYFRVRTVEQGGAVSAWTATNQVTIQHPSSAVLVSPGNGAALPDIGSVSFDWNFADTSSLDSQTAYQLIMEISPDDFTYTAVAAVYPSYSAVEVGNPTYASLQAPPTTTRVLDTGKVISTDTNRTVATPDSLKNKIARWSVATWDDDDQSAGFTNANLILLADLPEVSITSPRETTTTPTPVVTWTYSSIVGSPQIQFRVQFLVTATGEVLFDSGLVNSAGTSYTPPTPALQNGLLTTLKVTVVSANGMQVSGTVPITPQWIAPPNPSFTVDAYSYESIGLVDLEWITAPYDPTFIRWKIYRRDASYLQWELIGTSQIQQYLDYTAPPLGTVQYAVTQEGIAFGQVVESPLIPVGVNLSVSTYLISIEGEPGSGVMLPIVTEDDFDDEFESEVMEIMGAGRKAEKGTHLGLTGKLTVQLRDGGFIGGAGFKFQAILDAYEAGKTFILRIPFGRIVRVHLDNPSYSRIPGVGRSEAMDVTIPYVEVTD